jgi:multimeric flavodoxin WrbA
MIKIIGICGSRIREGNTEAFLDAALSRLKEYPDAEGELVVLAGKEFNGCVHCNWCVRKQTEGRFCAQDDDLTPIYEKLLTADGVVLASPAHFGRLSGRLADAIDRMRVFVHGNVYGTRMKNKIGGAMAVSYYRGAGLETTLASINALFYTLHMIIATSGLYHLGAGAVSSRDGKGRFEKDPRHIVLEDELGMLSARMLIDRMVELARIVRAGQAALRAQELLALK